MKKPVWNQTYNINSFLVNPEKKLGLYGLLNIIQDSAWIHATHLGHGHDEMIKDKTAWVITRQKVHIDSWPRWGEDIIVKTWIRPMTGLLAIRDFEFICQDKLFGYCTTQWLILDLGTRKPAAKSLHLSVDEFRQDSPTFFDAKKIILKNNLKEISELKVRNSDLDLNGHVNNTKYAQWILDSVSYEKHLEYTLQEYEVNFLNEAKAGDSIKIFGDTLNDDRFQFQGVRLSDGKILFAATMVVSA